MEGMNTYNARAKLLKFYIMHENFITVCFSSTTCRFKGRTVLFSLPTIGKVFRWSSFSLEEKSVSNQSCKIVLIQTVSRCETSIMCRKTTLERFLNATCDKAIQLECFLMHQVHVKYYWSYPLPVSTSVWKKETVWIYAAKTHTSFITYSTEH